MLSLVAHLPVIYSHHLPEQLSDFSTFIKMHPLIFGQTEYSMLILIVVALRSSLIILPILQDKQDVELILSTVQFMILIV